MLLRSIHIDFFSFLFIIKTILKKLINSRPPQLGKKRIQHFLTMFFIIYIKI